MRILKKLYLKILNKKDRNDNNFLSNGKIPWTKGYDEYKWQLINDSINNKKVLEDISKAILPLGFGIE